MTSALTDEAVLTLVKNKLRGERVKLWLPPYSNEDGTEAEFTLDLKKRFAEQLCLPTTKINEAVDTLRVSSVERQNARNQFLIDSVAKLKIKVAGGKNKQTSSHIIIETKLDESGASLKQQIADHLKVEKENIKLIANGRLLSDVTSLKEQNISVTTSLMAIIIETVKSQANKDSFIQQVRKDAELLANKTADDDDTMMEIADQNNRPIDIPLNERKAITLAMILNEKGKSAMQRKEYSTAVVLLLEADKEFQKCGADILKLVDNYALLCMDIAWCYLRLNSIEDLPDAESRLRTCEEYLKRCYGEKLERLISIKGTTGCEAVLFVRLKLLKGIAAFYRRQWKLAGSCFSEVENEIKKLTIDDEKLSQVLSMGYLVSEARLALRSCSNNVSMAVDYLVNKAKEREKLKKEEEEKRKLKEESKMLGKTADNQWVNANLFEKLLAMEFPPDKALQALKQSNNNISLAVEILHDNPDLLKFAESDAMDVDITKLVDCGFSKEVAENCLKKHSGNVEAAIEELISSGGEASKTKNKKQAEKATGSTSSADDKVKLRTLENEAFNRLQCDISASNYEDSYLDFTLEEENQILQDYQLLLIHAKR